MSHEAGSKGHYPLLGRGMRQNLGAISWFWLFASAAFAAGDGGDELDKRTQMINVDADYSIPVDKSNTVDGTDFGAAYRLSVVTYAGKSKSLGLGLRYETVSTKFTQADGSLKSQWTDFALSYKIWMLYPSLFLGSVTLEADKAGVELVNAVGVTRGAGLAVRSPAGAIATMHCDFLYGSASKTRDLAGRVVGITGRLDADLGVTVKFPWNNLDLTTGYRYRSYKVEIDGSTQRELETGPYVGLNLGFSP